ncbi:MAG: hypothetical protein MUF71_12395 [Candidatus Kapabacteria bacterium]|nr:hypothetical protein [Candidatus Kapabacteria bacterium]
MFIFFVAAMLCRFVSGLLGHRTFSTFPLSLVMLALFCLTSHTLSPSLHAQTPTPHPESEVGINGESRDFRSVRSGRWVDLSTWQVYRSGVWVAAGRDVGVPNPQSNAFIEAGHTVTATRAVTEVVGYNGAQGLAFIDINNLHIHTTASITTTWGSVVGGFAPQDWYDGDRFGGIISTRISEFSRNDNPNNLIGNRDIIDLTTHPFEPIRIPRPRNNELRIYGKLRYYAGSAFDRSDRDARMQVTAATIGTGSTLVFRGVSRTITTPEEWSTTLATQTGHFDNTAYTASMLASNPPERHNNFRGLMGRNSFWTAIFDLGRVVDRNFSSDQFTGPTDDPSTAIGTLGGAFTAGIIQVRRGTLRVEAPALLANEGSVTSGILHVMNNAVLQLATNTNVGRTGVFAEQFARSADVSRGDVDIVRSTECRVTSRMRYCVVEEGGAIDFTSRVGSISAADVRFNGTVIYSRLGDQTLVQDSPYLSYNPAGPVIAGGICAGENGLFDPYNNNFNANVGVQQQGDPTSGVLTAFGSSPSGLGIGTAALFQPSTTAAYSHLTLRGTGTKFLPVTTVTISRALLFQGEARLGLQNLAYPGVPVSAFSAQTPQTQGITPILPYYLSQAHGGELRTSHAASKAGFFPPLVYLRSTGLTGFREENNIGTTLRTSLSRDGSEMLPANATPQPMWSAYGGNTDAVAFVGFTTASTRIIIYDQILYPEGASFPVGITLSAATNREQVDMSPSVKTPVIHGLPAEPSYFSSGGNPLGGNPHGHGFSARAVWYGDTPQTLDGARFGQVIRQTLDRVNGTQLNGTQTATEPMQKPTRGVPNFVNGFPVITNSLYNAPINTTATTTLQYDTELSQTIAQAALPQGVWGPHNLVINAAQGVSLTLPVRTADVQTASESGVNWGAPHLNFANRMNAITGASSGTIIVGPEHVITSNGHLPRHAFNPRTGLFQPQAVYVETESGRDTITPGTLASSMIDTRPDEAQERTKLFDRYYTTGIGTRSMLSSQMSFDGRVRAAFSQDFISVPSVFGTTQTISTLAPNDFGRRGDWNNFGVLELRQGTLIVPNLVGNPSYIFSLSSTAIISAEQRNVTYRGDKVGSEHPQAKVCLSELSAQYLDAPKTQPSAIGVRESSTTGQILVRGSAGPNLLNGILQMGNRISLVITGGTGGTIDVASRSPMLRFAAPSRVNTGFDELPATLGIPGLTAFPPNNQAPSNQVTINPAPDPNSFNNSWNLDLPFIKNGVGNMTMLRGTSNILTLVGNFEGMSQGRETSSFPEQAGLQAFGTVATARGRIDLNGRNIELDGLNSSLVEAFERTDISSTVVNRHLKVLAYIGTSTFRQAQRIDSAQAAQMLASGGLPLAMSFAGLGATIINADSTRFQIQRWQSATTASILRRQSPISLRSWLIVTSGTFFQTPAPRQNFGLVLNFTTSDLPATGVQPSNFAILRAQRFGLYQALIPESTPSLNRFKQFSLLALSQIIRGRQILNVTTFAALPLYNTLPRQFPDINNPFNSTAGFERWTLGTPAPAALVLRGQRFGGKFGDPIGAGFEGAGADIVGFPRPFGSFTADAPDGGISRATAQQYGAIIGPFKAGVPTCATIIGEVVDEFGNTAQFLTSTGAALVVGQVGGGNGPWNTGVPRLLSQGASRLDVEAHLDGRMGALSQNGRFEWSGVRLDGIASTTVTFSLASAFVDTAQRLSTINTASLLRFADPHPVQVSLQGGFPFSVTFATQNANNTEATRLYPGAPGPFAAPGRVAGTPGVENSGYDGSIPTNLQGTPTNGVVVGQTVSFNNAYSTPGFSSITVVVKDRFGNYASFPTTATISISGGSPPVDRLRTPIVGQQAASVVVWGLGNLGQEGVGAPQLAEPGLARVYGDGRNGTRIAQTPFQVNPVQLPSGSALLTNNASLVSPALAPTGSGYAPFNNPQIAYHIAQFPNFQIWGATSSNVTLTVSSTNFDPNGVIGIGAPGSTSAIINIVPDVAIALFPVVMPDPYNNDRPDRMPSRMFIGKSNRNDPRTWFYAQAVDRFRNRVDNGPNVYNYGGVATITFNGPDKGLPRSDFGNFQFSPSDDPHTKVNNQLYRATGTSAVAVNGLFTFNDFTPLGPSSIDALGKDVCLTIQDPALPGFRGVRFPFDNVLRIFPPPPPITTATTTFVEPPILTLAVSDSLLNGARKAAPGGFPSGLFLRERARTYLSTSNLLETGFIEVQRPQTARAFSIPVQIGVEYFTANGGFDTTGFRISNRALFTPLPEQGNTSISLPALIIPAADIGVPTLFPPFPRPTFTSINGLLGDLSPITTGRNQALLRTGTQNVEFDSGATTQRIRFSARFSDQVYPRNSARQGLRLAVVRLRSDLSSAYTVQQDSAFVVLADPAPVPPVCVNPLPDRQVLLPVGNPAPIQETIEIETPEWRIAGNTSLPQTVFYDDNYEPLRYEVSSSDTTLVQAFITSADMRFVGRPTLTTVIPPFVRVETSASIILSASDGAFTVRDTFVVVLRRPVGVVEKNVTEKTSQGSQNLALSVMPNPLQSNSLIEITTPEAGLLRVSVLNGIGAVVWREERFVSGLGVERLTMPVVNLPSGVYMVEARIGVHWKSVRVVKQ